MSLILVAHGTRSPAGVTMVNALATQVSTLVGRPVEVAFVDVLGPTPTDVLLRAGATARRAVVVPAFLSRGYHVRADLPTQVAASGHPNVTVTPALGPSGQLARLVGDQLVTCGWRPGDSVVLAAAGTSDDTARADLHTTATLLSALTGSRVSLAFAAATGGPQLHAAVARARSRDRRDGTRVVVASYLLADGLFQERLSGCGADLVSRPLGAHPGLARLVANRFRRAVPPVLARPSAHRPTVRPGLQALPGSAA